MVECEISSVLEYYQDIEERRTEETGRDRGGGRRAGASVKKEERGCKHSGADDWLLHGSHDPTATFDRKPRALDIHRALFADESEFSSEQTSTSPNKTSHSVSSKKFIAGRPRRNPVCIAGWAATQRHSFPSNIVFPGDLFISLVSLVPLKVSSAHRHPLNPETCSGSPGSTDTHEATRFPTLFMCHQVPTPRTHNLSNNDLLAAHVP